ncbi:MAG: efflux RND transporter periplasmic adaptor subunit [Lysobacteraceae bacterium]|nr:MAG: efflux RND transporter periplasmic adaptor subunit [Xanthomonadaceae bacterium]
MSDRHRHRRFWWPLAAGALALALAAAMMMRAGDDKRTAQAAAQEEDPPTIVEIGLSERRDIPVLLEAVGTVEPENTVLVRSRIDGRVTSVGFREGQDVAAGAVLFEIDPRPARAALERARALHATSLERVANARRDLKRLQSLADQKLVSMQMLDTARSEAEQFEEAASADRAEVERLRLELDEAVVRAPFAGRTGERLVDVGNVVRADDERGLVVLSQLRPIQVGFPVPGAALARVRAAQQARGPLRVSVHERDSDRMIAEGDLSLIDNAIDQATGTIRLKARFANDDEALWPGDFVVARLRLEIRRHAVTVPAPALQDGPKGRYVYRVGEHDEVTMQAVEVDGCDRTHCVITHGLEAGVRVVTDGQHKLEEGMRVAAPKRASGAGSP